MEAAVISYCRIRNHSVWVNGNLLVQSAEQDNGKFLSESYKYFELNYPKFHKMDKLCKLGILATGLLVRNTEGFEQLPKQEMALVFSNNSSSLESDRTHAASIADKENYFPSPSVFVYTLPNIVIGEIAIKHKITGENAFFLTEKFDAELMQRYGNLLLKDKPSASALCGWINSDGADSDAFVYCIKNLNFKQEKPLFYKVHDPGTLQHLYDL